MADTLLALATDPEIASGRCVAQLQTLQGSGAVGAWTLTTEIFAWRQIRNGRELGLGRRGPSPVPKRGDVP